mmetsp:Transcript_122043/g.390261  ORF Transcript_122043/g.390261 Transcript_122043/m.390261 type:complete len:234 (+) Transcript_122043:734-1435(+)
MTSVVHQLLGHSPARVEVPQHGHGLVVLHICLMEARVYNNGLLEASGRLRGSAEVLQRHALHVRQRVVRPNSTSNFPCFITGFNDRGPLVRLPQHRHDHQDGRQMIAHRYGPRGRIHNTQQSRQRLNKVAKHLVAAANNEVALVSIDIRHPGLRQDLIDSSDACQDRLQVGSRPQALLCLAVRRGNAVHDFSNVLQLLPSKGDRFIGKANTTQSGSDLRSQFLALPHRRCRSN